MQDLTKIPLHEILLANGYELDRTKSSKLNPVLKNPKNNEKLIISKKGENYLYFNPNEFSDRGNIFSFARIRNLNVKNLIQNYDKNIHLAKQYKHNFFTTTKDTSTILNEFKGFKALDKDELSANILFKAKSFDSEYIKQFANHIKQDERGNIVIPNYKMIDEELGESYKDKFLMLCGYTKRLNYPITKDKDGIKLEKPIKSLQKGIKGLEILNINKETKDTENIIISESIIDSLSLGELKGYDPKTTMFISTNGNFNMQNTEKSLAHIHEKIPNARFKLAFDNDENGRKFQSSLEMYLIKLTRKNLITYIPFSKDYNDDLKISKITGLKSLNQETYQNWVTEQIHRYYIRKDLRPTLLHNFRKLHSMKKFNEENIQLFNSIRKHKAIKGL